MADVRRELADEDTLQLMEGISVPNEVSPSQFLLNAIELEEQQRAVERASPKAMKRSTVMSASHAESKAVLQRRIARWLPTQAIYMPAAIAYRQEASASNAGRRPVILVKYGVGDDVVEDDASDGGIDGEVEEERNGDEEENGEPSLETLPSYLGVDPACFNLLLPSALPSHVVAKCAPQIVLMERRLRLSQMETCLRDIRRLVRIKASVWINKGTRRTGQKSGTRSHAVLSEFTNKIHVIADRYRYARVCLLALNPSGRWQKRLLLLRSDDLRAPHLNASDVEDENVKHPPKTVGVGIKRKKFRPQSSREISWIWRVRCMENIQEWMDGDVRRLAMEEGMETLDTAPQEAHNGVCHPTPPQIVC